MESQSELLNKVIIFLIVLVSGILVFSQYQFSKLMKGSYLVYISIVLIAALVGLIIWAFLGEGPVPAHQTHHNEHHRELEKPTPFTFMEKVSYGMVALVAVIILFNQVQISQASALMGVSSGLSFSTGSGSNKITLTGDPSKDALSLIPKGTRFYSQGLGVSFDDPIRSLEIIAQLDPAYGKNKVQLSAQEKARYIKIGMVHGMGCEYCCGADTAVTSDGRPTCGCKHSWATRGLLAYLVKNYPQLSDDEIMHSLAEWKVMFFPKQMLQKYVKEAQTGQYTTDIRALLLDPGTKNIESAVPAASSANTKSANDVAATIDSLPSQVGGC